MKGSIILLGVVVLLVVAFPSYVLGECDTYVAPSYSTYSDYLMRDDPDTPVPPSTLAPEAAAFLDPDKLHIIWHDAEHDGQGYGYTCGEGPSIYSWGGAIWTYDGYCFGLSDLCHYSRWDVEAIAPYDPNTYNFDCDDYTDAEDEDDDTPPATDTKGLPENTATDNKGNVTQGCHKETPGNQGGGMPRLFVNLSTLNFILEDKDIHYFTLGPTIRFARYYNATSTYEGIFGRGWTFSYGIHLIEETSGDVVVVRGTGAEDLFTSQGDGTYTPPKVIYDTLTKNADDTFTLWVNDEKMTYAFTADGLLSSITDTNNNAVTLSYDANDLLTTITDASGRTISFAYNADDKVETITDPTGQQITFTYENGDMKTSTDVAGVTTTFAYDADHLLTSMTTPNGTTSYTYQDYSFGKRLATVTDAGENITQYAIDAPNQEVLLTDPEGYTTHYGYNYYGYTTYITDHLGNTTTYEYDSNGNRNKVIDAGGKETTLVYDSNGNITSITNHLDQTTTFVYDGNDNLTDMTDPLTRTYHFDYDANENLTQITDPLTNETEFVYLSNGLLEKITDARDMETSFTYDQYGNIETVTDPLNHTTSFTYYADSDKMQTSILPAPLSYTTTYEYDPLGRLTKRIHSDATEYIIHRYCSGISGITDENGLYTGYEHDNINQRTKIIHALAGYETEFSYDGNGNLVLLTDPKDQATAFEYYENNWLKKITYPEGAEESYTYNPVGTLATKTDANSVVTTYGYDDLHRLTSITAPDLAIAYTYDAVGNLDTMTDATGTTDYAYDDLDRLTNITYPNAKTIDYTYDAVGNITSIATDFGTVTYGYYDNNLLHTITLPNSQQVIYQYDAADNLTRIDYPNGTYTVFTYDTRNRLTAMTNYAPGDTVISTYAYTLDGVGNRTNTDLLEPLIPGFDPGTINYTYNLGNILATADTVSYTHDANGNRTQKVAGAVTVDYTYDPLNRLTQVADGTQTTQYIYNGLGQRVGKIEDGVQTNYLIDPNGILPQVLAEMDENNNLIAFYVYDGAGLVAKVTSASEYYFYHYDGLGSTVAITDENAQIVNAYAYSPYGLLGAQETINNPFTYVGRFGVMAEGHGLYYMRARYYDPEVGRFINKDPIGYAGGMNLYGYVRGNPVNIVDPVGLWGMGLAVSESTEGGAYVLGAGQTGSAGVGLFWKGRWFFSHPRDVNIGAFASWGGFARFLNHVSSFPSEECDEGNWATNRAVGAYAGAGVNFFVTDADSISDLSGPAWTFSINVGWKKRTGALQVTRTNNGKVLISYGGPFPGLKIVTGLGYGASMSLYKTNTWGKTIPLE